MTIENITLVNDDAAVRVRLVDPTTDGFLVLAAEAGRWIGPLAAPSRTRRTLTEEVADMCERLSARPEVVEAVVFRGALRPPGEGAELLRRAGVRPARYDLVVLIRLVDSADAVGAVRADPAYRAIADTLGSARHVYEFAGENAARIADVDHGPDH